MYGEVMAVYCKHHTEHVNTKHNAWAKCRVFVAVRVLTART